MARKRYPPDEARKRILDAAENALKKGGIDSVKVQTIARELGITDAAIHHHFAGRRGLLEALLRRSGRRLREALAAIDPGSPTQIVESMARVYDDEGVGELAMGLYAAGWRDPGGSGMLAGLVDAVHAMRVRAGIRAGRDDTARALAWLHLSLATEPLYGGAILRSVGLPGTRADRAAQRAWIAGAIHRLLFVG
jgi:AcrR family transcriptional regulator